MKSLQQFIYESEWKENKEFISLYQELKDNEDKIAKCFKGAVKARVGGSKSEIYLTIVVPKGKKLDLYDNLKELLNKTKNFKNVMNEIECYCLKKEYDKENDKYELVVAQDNVAGDNFEYIKSHNKDAEIEISLSKLN